MVRSFYLEIKELLKKTDTLLEAERRLANIITSVEAQGKIIGFVVGKITPTNTKETLLSNKAILDQKTQEIARLVENNNIVLFSSAALPDSTEGKYPLEAFYDFFDRVIRAHIKILYTTYNWKDSKGAVQEITMGRNKGIEIWHYQHGNLQRENGHILT